ncbi:hypothetical protein DAPPUDRAFT_320138 [Daphnia pulex]|uniref:RING-type domain-containing protein n=1 Tax=Daphnia pulex TaxID=6669 RepID=E9GNY8_DAPPU|nr:hypothetical protein DAPPUDRAFT_320138 [Daphnia pulex]|eukprot:EFX78861.1 hypothetical protein DAPPUDRAFT_320138 [Daphnia pulex]
MADPGGAELYQDEFLCCSICFHKYDLQLMRPKVLPCSHTFCFTCLKALHSGNTLKCPVCRREAVEITDVLTLPNNKYVQYIVHLSEKLRDAQAQIKRNNMPVLHTYSIGCVIEVLSDPAPKNLRVLDWGHLVSGCAFFSGMLLLQNPDIVFVKDIDGDLLHLLKKAFPKFKCITSEKLRVVVILNETVSYDSHFTISLPEDEGYRNDFILEVNAHCGPMKFKLLHTELNAGAGQERHGNHLKAIFRRVRHTDNNVNVILGIGGYVSNKKLMDAGGLPKCLQCMWEACGKPQKCKLKFSSDVARLTIESLNEDKFTADLTRLDYVYGSDRFFLSPSALEAFIGPKSFRLLSLHKHSVYIVDLIINHQDT